MRRAKIVATLGPALDDRELLRAAVESGIDVVRLNLSHGEPADHLERLRAVQEVAADLDRPVGSLADLPGPKIRVGDLPDGQVDLVADQKVRLLAGAGPDGVADAAEPCLPVAYDGLADDVAPGSMVLLDDGRVRAVVTRVQGSTVHARVVVGGTVASRKGVNLPGSEVGASVPTAADLELLDRVVGAGVDWIGASFVRTPEDVAAVRREVRRRGGDQPVVAKIERAEAVDRIERIAREADAVMVARGDLGVEIGPEQVPAIQKRVIDAANAELRPVITATEMLESMVDSPRPTRAEASDVANAVFDGSDAVMLSGETAAGRYPVDAVRTMARVVEVAESAGELRRERSPLTAELGTDAVVTLAASSVAAEVGADAIVVHSLTGASIQLLSTHRPAVPVLGLTPSATARGRTSLMWGVQSRLVDDLDDSRRMVEVAEAELRAAGLAGDGDLAVIVSGLPGAGGGTNRLTVHRVGDEVGA